MPLPPRSPDLNPTKNVWKFIRQNWLSNGVFKSYDDILDCSFQAWNRLLDQPWKIMSLGLRDCLRDWPTQKVGNYEDWY